MTPFLHVHLKQIPQVVEAGTAPAQPALLLDAGGLGVALRDDQAPQRIAEFGPLTFQNDDVLIDRLGPERVRKIKLLNAGSSRLLNAQDSGAIYAYEVVNFVDGKRTLGEIRDAVAGEFGPISLELVSDYLQACEEAKIIAFR